MPKDVTGRDIKVGDIIAYPDRRGACMWLNTAFVVDIIRDDTTEYYYLPPVRLRVQREGQERTSTVSRLDRVVVIR